MDNYNFFMNRLYGMDLTRDLDGKYTTGTQTVVIHGTTRGKNLTINSVDNGPGIYNGMAVSGTGIAANTYIQFSARSYINPPYYTSGTVQLNQSVTTNENNIVITLNPGGSGKPITHNYTVAGQRLGDYINLISGAPYTTGTALNCNLSAYLSSYSQVSQRKLQRTELGQRQNHNKHRH